MRNLFGLVISFIFIAIVLVSAKLFEKSGKEASRKYIHIVLSNWWIIAMVFFDSPIWASILPLLFVFVNFISYKYNIIKAMERDESEKDGLGTVYYAITLLVLAIVMFGPLINYKNIFGPIIGLAGIIVMGYGDGLAAVVGKSVKSPEYRVGNTKKTLAGSATMFLIAFIVLSGFLAYISSPYWYIKSIVISLIITVFEAISIKGTDNITVPLGTVLLLLLAI